jgi:hypothetical protein
LKKHKILEKLFLNATIENQIIMASYKLKALSTTGKREDKTDFLQIQMR